MKTKKIPIGGKMYNPTITSGWISVEDDLPENHEEMVLKEPCLTEDVIIAFKNKYGRINYSVNVRMLCADGKWTWFGRGNVVAWMPFPKYEPKVK